MKKKILIITAIMLFIIIIIMLIIHTFNGTIISSKDIKETTTVKYEYYPGC